MSFKEIIISLIIGIVSGVISGYLVSIYFERKSKQRQIEEFWRDYLWKSLEYCKMNVPIELIEMLKPLGGQNGRFGTAVININDILYPQHEEEMSEEQQELFKNFLIAFEEYNKWLHKNKSNQFKHIHLRP